MCVHTDFVIGDLDRDMGWKLKGPLPSCKDVEVLLPLVSAEIEPYMALGLVGLRG
jgi:hypothetical protein